MRNRMIKHHPIFDTDKVCDLYSKKDKVPISYVITTALNDGTNPVDVFYRATPHPEFGNRYFGLFVDQYDRIVITSADIVEDLEFACVFDDNDDLQYSSHRWDFKQYHDSSIDGGRAYVRFTGNTPIYFKVINGIMIPCKPKHQKVK